MSIVIGHHSAIELLARHALTAGSGMFQRTKHTHIPAYGGIGSLEAISNEFRLSRPVSVLVSTRGDRHSSDLASSRLWSNGFPRGSLLRVGDDVYVSSAEFAFLQMADRIAFEERVMLAYELCGTYTMRSYGEDPYSPLESPLITKRSLERYLGKAKDLYGHRKAVEACKWAKDRSHSPEETKFAMAMGLSRHRGGQACCDFEMNYEVKLSKEEWRHFGAGTFKIDLFWKNAGIGLEYYGEEHHTGRVRETRDLRRESILAAKGIEVHGITKVQARSVLECMRLAKLLHRASGKRFVNPTRRQYEAMCRLNSILYPHK